MGAAKDGCWCVSLFFVGKECLEDLKNRTIWSAAPLPYINGLGLEMHLPLMALSYLLFR